jgi:hypothetical protein
MRRFAFSAELTALGSWAENVPSIFLKDPSVAILVFHLFKLDALLPSEL